jgi:hypothetical protein
MDAALAQLASARQVGKDHFAMKKFATKDVHSMDIAKMAPAFVNKASLEGIALSWVAVKTAIAMGMVLVKLTVLKTPKMVMEI